MRQEYDVTYIWECINDFWKMFSDAGTLEQLWRGYAFITNNLYYQLYQLNLSKSIHTIRHQWISDWEVLILNDYTKVDEGAAPKFPGYTYVYTLPYGVKNVTEVWDSPREVTNLPPMTILIAGTDRLKLPDGTTRHLEDAIYMPNYVVTADNGDLVFPDGVSVDTKKFYPETDFMVDEVGRTIHFKVQPYQMLWSHLAIRDLETIYENFGCLIKYYKPDGYKYLREVQGLWWAYWHGAAINNIVKGITILRDMPFALEAGFVDNIDYVESKVTIGGTVYDIPPTQTITVAEGDFVNQFTPLTSAIGVFDYINFPNWWREYLGLWDGTSDMLKYACHFDGNPAYQSGYFDKGDFDEYFTQQCVDAALLQYFTFLVKIEQNVWFRTKAEIDVVKAFLEAIKPAYTHYIFECELMFTDSIDMTTVDNRLFFGPWAFVPRDVPCDFHHFDDLMHPFFDDGSKFDFDRERDYLWITVWGSPQIFSDNVNTGWRFDDPAMLTLDSNSTFDKNPLDEKLEIAWTPSNTLSFEDEVSTSDSLDISDQ